MRIRGSFGEYETADEPFAAGGSARLFRCRPRGYVYKAYRIPVQDRAEINRLRRIRGIGRRILVQGTDPMASIPESSVNWPIDTIELATPAVAGVIIPEIPARFFSAEGNPRGLDFLILARADPPAAGVRLAVLIRLAEIFAWLDAQSLTHGDLSQRNVVWCQAPEPGAYLLDADGIRPNRPSPTVGLATPGWTDPRLAAGLIPAHDQHSDHYALAVAMYRGLLLNPGYLERTAEGSWPKPAALPVDLDPAIRQLLERSLGAPLDAAARATPGEWVKILLDTYVTPAGFDAAKLAVLDRHAQVYRDHHRQRASAPRPTPRTLPRPVTPRPAPRPGARRLRPTMELLRFLFLYLVLPGALGVAAWEFFIGGNDSKSLPKSGFSGDGGPAVKARLSAPDSLAVDTEGNLYIADSGNQRVRRIDRAGIITTVAGGGVGAAKLSLVTGLATDGTGNLYIADVGRIWKLGRSGTMTIAVETSETVTVEGEDAASHLRITLGGLAADAKGNLYLPDPENRRVVRVDPNGTVTVVPGTADPRLWDGWDIDSHLALTVDRAGNLYIAISGSLLGRSFKAASVSKVDPAGTTTTLARAFHFPHASPGGLTVDAAGNVYLAEYVGFVGTSALSRIDPAGAVKRLAVSMLRYPDPGDIRDYSLVVAKGVAVDAAGNVYVASKAQHRVVRVSPDRIITTVAGKRQR